MELAVRHYLAQGIPNNVTNANFICNIQNYTNSATNKTVLIRMNDATRETASIVGLWRNTAPITSMQIFVGSGTFLIGSTFTIYGVAQGNSSAKATGGNIVTTDGVFWYHAFTSSGAFIPSTALTADYAVIAGGAGGGYSQGGGGGAGGVLSTFSASLSANTVYPAVVGAGGVGSTSLQAFGSNGTDSVFISSTAIGGGGGATGGVSGRNGGSGGGAGNGGSPGNGTVGQGNNGGTASNSAPNYGGGGGGGAGGVGGNGTSGSGGNGGAGVNTWSSWLSSLNLGVSGFIAGGGGAGTFTGGTAGTGGSGGGGNAGVSTTGQAGFPGVANTGSGGGGSSYGPSFPGSAGPGGNGASGLIIIRYAV